MFSRLCIYMCMVMCIHVSTCVYMWPHVSLYVVYISYIAILYLDFVSYTCAFVGVSYMYRYRIVGTQCGFSPLCVANLFVLGLLLILLLDLM